MLDYLIMVQEYWVKKTKGQLDFSKASLKTALNNVENCYFHVGNVTRKQAIGIPNGK